jgi:PhnB protein
MTKTQSLSPYIAVKGASDAIEFYKQAFGAEEKFRLVDPSDGRIGHAEIQIGNVVMMLSDEYPDFGALSPESLGGSPVKFQIYVPDADAAFANAISLGATELRPLAEQFFGDRSGMLLDPFGHSWTIATQVEDVSPEEMQARWNAGMEG